MARIPKRVVHDVMTTSSATYYTVPTSTSLEITSIVISNITANTETVTLNLGGLDFPNAFEVPANDMITIPLTDSPIKLNADETIDGVASTESAINIHIAGVEVS
jgi:hypothetical protein